MSLQRSDRWGPVTDDQKFARRLTLEDAFVVQTALLEEPFVFRTALLEEPFVFRTALLEEPFVFRTDPGDHKLVLQHRGHLGLIADDHKFDRRLTLEDAFVVQTALLEEPFVFRTGLLEEPFVVGTDPGEHEMGQQRWDYYGSLAEDRRFERRLLLKEFLVLPLLLAALAIRVFFG